MRHDDLPTVSVLSFLGFMSASVLVSAVYSAIGLGNIADLGLFCIIGGLISLSILTYYVLTGGYPISKRQIDDALGKLRG